MQRLSLDPSSASKFNSYGGRKDDTYDLKAISSSPSSASAADDDDIKEFKPRRLSAPQSPFATTHQKQEKLVHFIPILTLICFMILYLNSHAPSQSDLAQFNGFMRPIHRDSDENGEISGFIRSDTLAIRSSVRNLQETAKSVPSSRNSHRKIADF